MFRFICVVIFLITFLIVTIPVLAAEWLIGKFNPKARDISSMYIVRWGFRVVLKLAGVQATVIGEENVPDGPALFIGNHRSYFDILLTEELSMLPFKDGALKIATKTSCPVIPVSMNNMAQIFENHLPKIKKTHVVIEYGKPIYPDELDKDTKRHIGDYVENIIRETIHKNATLIENQ